MSTSGSLSHNADAPDSSVCGVGSGAPASESASKQPKPKRPRASNSTAAAAAAAAVGSSATNQQQASASADDYWTPWRDIERMATAYLAPSKSFAEFVHRRFSHHNTTLVMGYPDFDYAEVSAKVYEGVYLLGQAQYISGYESREPVAWFIHTMSRYLYEVRELEHEQDPEDYEDDYRVEFPPWTSVYVLDRVPNSVLSDCVKYLRDTIAANKALDRREFLQPDGCVVILALIQRYIRRHPRNGSGQCAFEDHEISQPEYCKKSPCENVGSGCGGAPAAAAADSSNPSLGCDRVSSCKHSHPNGVNVLQ